MSDPSLIFASIYIGAIFSTLIVGLFLRHVFRNQKLHVVAHRIVIILGALGVFCFIFGWSWMVFQVPNLDFIFPVLGLSILYSLIFGVIVTSGLKKSEKRKRKW